jgi:hypothetical protein
MRQEVRWTDLAHEQVAGHPAEAGTPVGVPAVERPLKEHGHVTRKARGAGAMGRHPGRDRRLESIARLKREYLASDGPVLSIGTKEEELIGTSYRAGRPPGRGGIGTFGHDSRSLAPGGVTPHGPRDVKRNDGHVDLGTSRDTGEFAGGGIRRRWQEGGRTPHPRARSIPLRCDGGGGDGAGRYPFKGGLRRLADRLGIEIRVAHHPPHCSGYDRIGHRLAPRLTRACRGVVLEGVGLVKELMEGASTVAGLRVGVEILGRVYRAGRGYAAGFEEGMRVVFDEILPRWNHGAIPSGS